jgi:hypothetical protein
LRQIDLSDISSMTMYREYLYVHNGTKFIKFINILRFPIDILLNDFDMSYFESMWSNSKDVAVWYYLEDEMIEQVCRNITVDNNLTIL